MEYKTGRPLAILCQPEIFLVFPHLRIDAAGIRFEFW
jgi:hypothetical protein